VWTLDHATADIILVETWPETWDVDFFAVNLWRNLFAASGTALAFLQHTKKKPRKGLALQTMQRSFVEAALWPLAPFGVSSLDFGRPSGRSLFYVSLSIIG
jgi:hypothetical protein